MSLAELDVHQQQLIRQHLELVIEANEKVNLTRIDSEELAALLHIEDSLSALPEIDKAPFGFYGDLGSGAGYPGIPLSIATGRETWLVDARKKKMDVVADIISQLGLDEQIHVYGGRAELLARKMAGEFAVLTARALAKLSVLLELASPLLKKDGLLICYKSHVDEDEYQHALRVAKKVGMQLASDRSFMLDEYERRILTYKKVSRSQVKLPRQEGAAQKQPL